MTRPQLFVMGAGTLALACAIGLIAGLRHVTARVQPRPPVEDAVADGDEAPIDPEPRSPRSHATDELLGLLIAGQSVDLEPKAPGRIARIAVSAGDAVKAGQLLVELDVGSLRRDLALARANLHEARARLARRLPLAHEGLVSSDELADARVIVRTKQEQVNQLAAQMQQAAIVAPFDGTVAVRYADAGAVVGPGKPVVRLLGTGGLRVRFVAPEERAAELSVGMPVRIAVPSQGVRLDGTIESLAPEVDSASRMIYGEARIDSPATTPARIASGVVARVTPLSPPSGS
jgi:RND family efflux transporter MFP subunit